MDLDNLLSQMDTHSSLNPKERKQLLNKTEKNLNKLGVTIDDFRKRAYQESHHKMMKVMMKAERDIVKKAIKNAQEASLDDGYIDFQKYCSLAEEDLRDANLLEEISHHSYFKNRKVLTDALDDLKTYRTSKAIKILKKRILIE